jgi:thioredoxin-related protein
VNKILFLWAVSAAILSGCRPEPLRTVNTPPVNLTAEIDRARSENKLLVLEFTGSDWCPACIEFHNRVLSSPEFTSYAKSNLVWVSVDFLEKSKLRPDTEATNRILMEQFKIEPFPTFIALDHAGNEIWRSPATNDSEPSVSLVPAKVIDQLETVRKKLK